MYNKVDHFQAWCTIVGNFIIRFLDHNGMRPIIVLVVIIGGIFITLNSHNICIIQEPPSVSASQAQIILRDNPVCSKYFEMAALVIGGILGLSSPGQFRNTVDSQAEQQQKDRGMTSSSDLKKTKNSQSQNTGSESDNQASSSEEGNHKQGIAS